MADPTDPSEEELLVLVRTVWEQRDPVPTGLVARMQAAATLAAEAEAGGLDLELMLLVERSEDLAGTRGAPGAAYTMRFSHAGLELLVRLAGARLDGWVVPPVPVTVTVQRAVRHGWADVATLAVGATGRFELPDLAPGLLRLRLEPGTGAPAFQTPAFEL
ncbi:hypothetical protein [Nocardioides flavescens]|uniref:Uncharacterized protein n=1 Tax=Nocardioides flavescens TaxID=2691959 RepID=A0A6L7F1V9_9ACTN|nr:hypothetical protein [Nocardioides flavescens]MXG91359.1 hypothetical protein [Nocardioides flavescens]